MHHMEMEQTTPKIAKKLWRIVRVVLYMLRKGLSKNKLWLDLHMLLKRGKLAGKAIGNIMLDHHYAALTCRSDDTQLSFVTPREYEFSCSNSPAYPSFYAKRSKHHHHHDRRRYHRDDNHGGGHDHVHVVQKVFEILNSQDLKHQIDGPIWAMEPVSSPLPGFGQSPNTVRPLRVTDSPFPVKNSDEDDQVNMLADAFIKKFYNELNQQKKVAALEKPSPLPYYKWS